MKKIDFEWDKTKALLNIRKHGISFEEASSVFTNEEAIVFDDPDHSGDEDRFLIIGFSANANLLVVCHCLRNGEQIIRIISARKATKTEAAMYTELHEGL